MIDVHAHLNDEKLIPSVERIARCMEADQLDAIINAGFDVPSSNLAIEQAEKYDNIFAVVGIHPEYAHQIIPSDYDLIKALALRNKCVGIGECGLDYYWDDTHKKEQQQSMSIHIQLADELNLPIVLHIRDAYEDSLKVLNQNKSKLSHGVLLHCYSASEEMVRNYNKLDCYYSFGGAITFKNAKRNIASLQAIPQERLLLETDCPYMTPVPFRGQTNEPKYVNLVAQKAAEVLGKSIEEIENITKENTYRLFYKIKGNKDV